MPFRQNPHSKTKTGFSFHHPPHTCFTLSQNLSLPPPFFCGGSTVHQVLKLEPHSNARLFQHCPHPDSCQVLLLLRAVKSWKPLLESHWPCHALESRAGEMMASVSFPAGRCVVGLDKVHKNRVIFRNIKMSLGFIASLEHEACVPM